jgi:hypothetical protein
VDNRLPAFRTFDEAAIAIAAGKRFTSDGTKARVGSASLVELDHVAGRVGEEGLTIGTDR